MYVERGIIFPEIKDKIIMSQLGFIIRPHHTHTYCFVVVCFVLLLLRLYKKTNTLLLFLSIS